ncbi:fumarylacetoacetate hydrolase family protein [Zymomonas mobilis]|uniref:fumarylacetoacetate hydrolase family protein n=1 Tax=Zymomonas mobilis TaxID=542 RepID=UPI001168E533|nr:fumarylacetoacetate hydrolase family protein [Zymomonas mobilis]MDX5949561.1 fumarylacetoacetate hydrolase family protein [Zymomonas mobilis subsp. pomaceae]GEB90019.1 fumarylacetoacetate hydrolase [Zymomonas mobilis subsp. pomaceae]
MFDYFVFPPPVTSLPVKDLQGHFPVRRIWCVGRNYADHSREMGSNPKTTPPFFFLKPADAITTESELSFPKATQDLHYEVELVVAIKESGENLTPEESQKLIFGYAVGLDMTRRDMQAIAKQNRQPWALSKGFDESCPISGIRQAAEVQDIKNSIISLSVNNKQHQKGYIKNMIWSVEEIISVLSQSIKLLPGDLIMTGTPAGVGSVQPGDRLEAQCTGIGYLAISYRK